MINLRTRLLVGYGYMMVLLLLTAGSAAFGFFTISEAIDRILEENFRSVAAAVEMMDALERQNVLTMTALLEEEVDQQALAEAERDLMEALANAKDNITIDGEDQVLSQVRMRYEDYVEIRNEVLIEDFEVTRMELFALRIFPSFVEVRERISALLDMNHQAIIVADREARDTALQMAGWLGFLVTIALLSMVFLARALQRKILIRLKELTDVAESLLTGNQSRRFEIGYNDELGVVSRQLNAALDERDELQAEMRGRLNQQKQLVLGLLEEVEGEFLLLGLDGLLIASTSRRFEKENLERVRSWLLENRPFLLQNFREKGQQVEVSAQPDGMPLKIRLLAAGGRRPVGWMIQIVDPEDDEESPGNTNSREPYPLAEEEDE